MHKNHIRLLLFIITVSLLVSCSITKDVSEHHKRLKPIRSSKKLYNKVEDNSLKYNSLSAKFSSNYKSEKTNLSFSGNLRIRKDSIIWISIRKMGIPGVLVSLTPDSVKIINYQEKNYTISSYDYLSKKLKIEINFKTIQSILTNEIFIYPISDNEIDVKIKRYKSSVDSAYYCLQSKKDKKIARKVNRKQKKNKKIKFTFHEILIIPEIFKCSKIYIEDYNLERSLILNYANFENVTEQMFSKKLTFKITDKKDQSSGIIKFKKVNFNKKLKYKFKIPKKYKVKKS